MKWVYLNGMWFNPDRVVALKPTLDWVNNTRVDATKVFIGPAENDYFMLHVNVADVVEAFSSNN
jgi:hypothetical protein